MTASHHVVASPVFDVLGELLFQLHGSLLTAQGRKMHPRNVQKMVAWLTLLEQDGSLPPEFRELCECLRDDWQQPAQPEIAGGYRMGMMSCAA